MELTLTQWVLIGLGLLIWIVVAIMAWTDMPDKDSSYEPFGFWESFAWPLILLAAAIGLIAGMIAIPIYEYILDPIKRRLEYNRLKRTASTQCPSASSSLKGDPS